MTPEQGTLETAVRRLAACRRWQPNAVTAWLKRVISELPLAFPPASGVRPRILPLPITTEREGPGSRRQVVSEWERFHG
jgi:hypothetical protein